MLGRRDIEELIPHRSPILMLDDVVDLVPGERATARRRLVADDAWFTGHFASRAILPGVLIVEACAQLVAVVAASAVPAGEARTARIDYLASIERFKFTRSAVPGDTLVIDVTLGRRFGNLLQARVVATVDGSPVGQGVLMVTSGGGNHAKE